MQSPCKPCGPVACWPQPASRLPCSAIQPRLRKQRKKHYKSQLKMALRGASMHCSAQASTQAPDLQSLKKALVEDTDNMFGDKGIDTSVYAQKVKFRDPITKYDDIQVWPRPGTRRVQRTHCHLCRHDVSCEHQCARRTYPLCCPTRKFLHPEEDCSEQFIANGVT